MLSITLKQTTRSAALLMAVLASLFYHPVATHALETVEALPTFSDFSRTVQNGDAKMLRGVYVENIFALPIVQQPSSSPAFVSTN